MHQVFDSAASSPCLPLTHESVLPSPYLNRIGTRNDTDFGAQWLACMDLHVERPGRKMVVGTNLWLHGSSSSAI